MPPTKRYASALEAQRMGAHGDTVAHASHRSIATAPRAGTLVPDDVTSPSRGVAQVTARRPIRMQSSAVGH